MKTPNSKIKGISTIITAISAILMILLLFITFSFEIKKEPLPMVIELALNDSNFGSETESNTTVEPLATEKPTPAPSNIENIQPQKQTPTTKTQSITQNTKKAPVASQQKAKETNKAKPKGDARAKSALENILGGKGSQKSTGKGKSSGNGNVGDPKGNTDQGNQIGENWKTRIPDNQSHECNAGGVVVVDIVVNANGNIKRATPQISSNDCLSNTAKSLVLKYVTAYPGSDNRRGSYRVILK